MIADTNKHLYKPVEMESKLFKPKLDSKGLIMPTSHGIISRRGNFQYDLSRKTFEYDFNETNRILDTEAFVARIFKKKKDLILKEDPIFESTSDRNLKFVKKRLDEIMYASNIDLSTLLTEIAESLVNYNNCFILRMANKKDEDIELSNSPLKSVHILSPIRLSPITNDVGETTGYHYRAKSGRANPIYIPAEYVYHLYTDKKLDCSVGTPPLEAVKDDILSLRQIEESMERLIYKNASPLLHAKIGTKDFPADQLPTGESEIDYYNRLISNMDDEGGLTTSHRVDIDLLGTESKALRFDNSMEYYKTRVLAGLSASSLDIGEANAISSSGAEYVSQVLKDDVISYQKRIERFFTNVFFKDILLHAYWYSNKNYIPEKEKVTFRLPDPNIESKIRYESHLANLVRNGLLSPKQFSKETGYQLPPNTTQLLETNSNSGSGVFSAQSTPQNQNTTALEAEYQVLDEVLSGEGSELSKSIYMYLYNNFQELETIKPLELITRDISGIVTRYKDIDIPVRSLSEIFKNVLEDIIVDNL